MKAWAVPTMMLQHSELWRQEEVTTISENWLRKKVNENKMMKKKLCQSKSSEETELLCFLRTDGNPEQIRVSNRIEV